MRMKLIITALLLLAPVSLAGDGADPETRFHDAFLAEVVEGKVAPAARIYFELLGDETAPLHLRREARFRFAVCCVLLGRADEGRARLAEILADPVTPSAMKARAEEYRKSLEGIGIGSELERRLQGLTFELARSEGSDVPKAYSDIRVIGKPAVPYLKRLLGHADERLRRHAFILLCMLDEPGMADEWKPGISRLMFAPFADYLNRRPEERKRIEQILTQLPTEMLPDALPVFRYVEAFSEEFLNGMADREGLEDWTFELLGWDHTDRTQLLRDWFASGREPISNRAGMTITSLVHGDAAPVAAVSDLFPAIVSSLVGRELNWRTWGRQARNMRTWSSAQRVQPRRAGLAKIAAAQPADVLLATLTDLVETGEEWEGEAWTNPLFSGLADAVADGLDAKSREEVDLATYATLVERWIACYGKLDLARLSEQNRSPDFPDEEFLKHLTYLFISLDAADAADFARRIYAGPAGTDSDFAKALYAEEVRSVRLVVAAADVATGSVRSRIIGSLPFFRQQRRGPGVATLAKEQAEALPQILSDLDQHQMQTVHDHYWWLISALPQKDALDSIVAMAAAGGDAKRMTRGLLGVWQFQSGHFTAYRVRIAVPALSLLWDCAPESYRRPLLAAAMKFSDHDSVDVHLLGEAKASVLKFIFAHVAHLSDSQLQDMIGQPELFPLESWVAGVPGDFWSTGGAEDFRLRAEACSKAAEALTRDFSKVNGSVIEFIRHGPIPGAEKQRHLSRLLLSGDPRLVDLVLRRVSEGHEIGADALEEFLEVALAMEKPDLAIVRQVSWLLIRTRPTEKLIPAAQELLASRDTIHRQMGIHLATELGKEELIPYLVKLLDSVDSSIRNGAKDAIDAIRELKRMREHVYK